MQIGGGFGPGGVDPWLRHLVTQGYVLVLPEYTANAVLATATARLSQALAELKQPGHAAVDLERFAVFGYSWGGLPAIAYAGNQPGGLPVAKAVFAGAPCTTNCHTFSTHDFVFPAGLKAIVFAIRDDNAVGNNQPKLAYETLASLPAEDREMVIVETIKGPGGFLFADHGVPGEPVNALDWYGLWKVSDALLACTFDGKWCEYSFGNTPEERYMGEWSDGTPLPELTVID